MSFDLTNKNISDTFQNLLQRTGSDNRLYDLTGNQVTNLRINGTLTADQYVVSSSVTNVITIAQSGSTIFGNSIDDTHQFTGNITASTNISASGTIFANSGSFNYVTASIIDVNSDTIRLGGETFKKSDIVKLKLGRSLKPAGAGRVHGDITSHDGAFDGNITASGDISASGIVFGSDIKSNGISVVKSITNLSDSAGNQGKIRFNNTAGAFTIKNISNLNSGSSPTFNDITASGVVSASGGFIGDGSQLTGLSSAAISTYTNNGNNRVVTSVNSTTVNSEANLTFDGTSLNVNGEITSSKVLVNTSNSTDDFFLLKSGSLDSLKVNNQGVMVLGGFTFTPTAVRGGMYYNQDDDEFYAGKNN